MMATDLAPKNKLKIKFGNRRLEVVPSSRPSLVNAVDFSKNGSLACANKRGPPEAIDNQRDHKRQKMDRGISQQCSAILRALISHKHGWVFSKPVDPVALKIPDYFSVISRPMDLGTVKSKLQKNLYSVTEEFAADIRLTFSNAMDYNPPGNVVYTMAKLMSDIFEMKWKSFEGKTSGHDRSKAIQGKSNTVRTVELCDTRQNCPKTPPLRACVLPKKSKMLEARVSCDLDVQPAEVLNKCLQSVSRKSSCKGSDSNCQGSVSAKPVLRFDSSDSTHTSSGITSDRSFGKDHSSSVETSRMDCQAKSTLSSQTSKSDQESDGTGSTLVNGNDFRSSEPSVSVDSTSGEGWSTPLFDVQMSPKRALRAAMLKSRFADTILKAQHKTLLDHGAITDPVKLRQEKEKLERIQREEKARIEAQIRAAETAARLKEETELKMKRQKEREAARLALETMEKTVEIYENMRMFKELEILSGHSLHLGNLKRFGLFLKDDFLLDVDEEDAVLNTRQELEVEEEEGEII